FRPVRRRSRAGPAQGVRGEDKMIRRLVLTVAVVTAGLLVAGGAALASPQDDLQALRSHYQQMFPDVPLDDYVNGPYAVNKAMRTQWESLKQFPPYTFALSTGEELFNTPFANGKSYADCFPNDGIGVRQDY